MISAVSGFGIQKRQLLNPRSMVMHDFAIRRPPTDFPHRRGGQHAADSRRMFARGGMATEVPTEYVALTQSLHYGGRPHLDSSESDATEQTDATDTVGNELRGAIMKVMVLGVRGIPDVQGGVETHALHLYTRLASMGHHVEVMVRSPFAPPGLTSYQNVELYPIWSPKTPGLEAFVHTLLGVFVAALARPDILHIHAVGPGLFAPLARLCGLKVVVTHHGPDYDRDKWGPFARLILRAGERFGMRFANARIAVSRLIADSVSSKFGVEADVIPNGVVISESIAETDQLDQYDLEPGKYFLQVSRVVPEKRQLDLIEAFRLASPLDWKLVLVGGLSSDDYSRHVAAAAEEPGVVLTGFLKGRALQQLYSHAGAFVLPSSHEGLPIALLEALSYGLPVLASDIPANLEIGLDTTSYFPLGKLPALAERLQRLVVEPREGPLDDSRRKWVAARFDWDSIAARTAAIYERTVAK
jgi:glycosyltransferase involved in cell wall biosynthesis